MKKIPVLLLLFVALLPLSAITFSSSLEKAQGDDRFFSGLFPVSGKFGYSTEFPDYFDEIGMSFDLDFDVGLKHRLLIQNPETGEHIDKTASPYSDDRARWYQVHYIYSRYEVVLDLISPEYLERPMLSVSSGFEADFENAYERLGWMSSDGNESTFSVFSGNTRKSRYSSYSSVAELAITDSYRKLSHTGLTCAIDFYYLEETRMTKNGISGNLRVSYMPSWFPLHDANGSSYFSVRADGSLALTLLDIDQYSVLLSESVLKMFTLVLESDFDFRFVTGNNVPQYAVERYSSGAHNASSVFLAGNTTSLVFRGPQITEDVYPVLRLASDFSYAFGAVVNGQGEIFQAAGSVYAEAEADLFDSLFVSLRASYVYASIYKGDEGMKYTFSLRIGI